MPHARGLRRDWRGGSMGGQHSKSATAGTGSLGLPGASGRSRSASLSGRHTAGYRWKPHQQNAGKATRFAHYPVAFQSFFIVAGGEPRLCGYPPGRSRPIEALPSSPQALERFGGHRRRRRQGIPPGLTGVQVDVQRGVDAQEVRLSRLAPSPTSSYVVLDAAA